jgi:hypothetical protein
LLQPNPTIKRKENRVDINFSNVGDVFASERHGRTVKFWCRALDGDCTDSKIIALTFANEAIAHAVQMESAWMAVAE